VSGPVDVLAVLDDMASTVQHAMRVDAPAVNRPTLNIWTAVRAELERLVNAEIWDEPGEDRAFFSWAWKIAILRMDDTVSWSEAMVDVPYASQWCDEEMLRLVHDGDNAELGRMVRKAMIREFAAAVYRATEKAWELGVEP